MLCRKPGPLLDFPGYRSQLMYFIVALFKPAGNGFPSLAT